MQPFKLERYFARYEFKVKYLLSASDCEGLPMADLLRLANPESHLLWNDLKLGYTESQGHPLLREEISRMYSAIPPEQIITAAPEEAILIAMNTLLEPGDHLISIFPAYQSLYELARGRGCDVTFWKLRPEGVRWVLDLDELEKALRPNTRLLVINFPHNPTGYLPSQGELMAIVAFARKHGLYLFSDEMYRLLEYSPDDRLPAVCDLYERGISLSGLSKSFALAGLRLGWLATQETTLLADWLAYKDYTTICGSAPAEILGLIALQNKDAILVRNRQIVAGNIRAAEHFFARYLQDFTWLPPKAGSVAFPLWNGTTPVEQFCQEALDRQSLMILPGSIFDFPGCHFRVGLGRFNLPQAFQALGLYLEEINK